jgi:hypothetical protein
MVIGELFNNRRQFMSSLLQRKLEKETERGREMEMVR